MKFKLKHLLCLSLIAISLQTNAVERQNMNDGWTFGQARLSKRYPATVPGVVHTDLMANGIIEDPFFGLNERGAQWIDKEDWIYETEFIPGTDLLAQDNIEVVFEGLDTYADVFLNDSPVISADNMFRTWKADIKPLLKSDRNVLKVYLHSPVKVDMPKWESHPNQYRAANDQSENGGIMDRKLSVFARKAGYHYGWDWGPRLVTSGIWRDVYLEGWSGARINNVYVRQHDVTRKSASVKNEVEIESDKDLKGVTVTVCDKDNGRILGSLKCDLHRGLNKVSVDFKIKNPRLWWCRNLGDPNLYTFTTTVKCPDGEVLSRDERVGLRNVKIVTDPDTDGTMQFYFVINGIPVFAKGSNYIPQDNFLPRVTEERYRQTVRDAADANMNMLRIWGGGIYENDIFYDLCDEMGIMVWQDFMFACSMYPAEGDWLENMKLEARDNLIRLRNHPSIVIWCGGNECLDAWYNWGWKSAHEKTDPLQANRIEKEMHTQYFVALPEMMKAYAPDSYYWTNSPFSGECKGSDGINGDRHYYGVWQRKHPISQYNNEKSHFFSEYGVQSFPQYSTILKYAPDTESHTLDSDVIMWHQRGGENANSLIAWYLENEYRKPEDFRDILYVNQLFQADAMRTAIEAHRRDMPHCMGSLLWQHDDCWPVASWSTRDYYGNWKAAHYLVKKAFDNVIASAVTSSSSLDVSVVSDLVKPAEGTLTVSAYTCDGKKITEKQRDLTIPANSSAMVWQLPLDSLSSGHDPNSVVINVDIAGKDFAHNGNYYLCRLKDLRLLSSDISMNLEKTEEGYMVDLKSDHFVRGVWISSDDDDVFIADNCFDLLPGQHKKTLIKNASSKKPELKIQSLNDI